MHLNGSSKLPHSLRLIIFFLRIALGLDFFYLGWSTLFNAPLGRELQERSLGALYYWLVTGGGSGNLQNLFAWAFIIIGACLMLGALTRLMSTVGIVLTLMSFIPTVSLAALSAPQFINDEVLVVLCLLILLFSRAGEYLGIDKFLHIRLSSRKKVD